MSRIAAHKRALASLLHTRNSKGYRGNPAISVLLEKLYGLHIILFGIATLIVSDQDIDLIDARHREIFSDQLHLSWQEQHQFIPIFIMKEDIHHILEVCPTEQESCHRLYDHTQNVSSAMLPKISDILPDRFNLNQMNFFQVFV